MGKSSLVKAIICFVVLFSFMLPANSDVAKAAYTFQGKVNVNVLNVRSKPGTSYSKIGTLNRNQIVSVTGKKKSWSKIVYGKKTGWVASKYLSPVSTTGYVSASSLNLRKSANLKSKVLTKLDKGTSLSIQGKNGSWLKVYVPSKKKTGWVSSKYVSSKKPVIEPKSLGTFYVTASTLNVRSQPKSGSKIVGKIKKGTSVKAINKKGSWYQIEMTANKKGWVSAKYISQSRPVSQAAAMPVTLPVKAPVMDTTKLVLVESSNIRKGPGTNHEILSVGKAGTFAEKVEEKVGWVHVKLSTGDMGWVAGWLVRPAESVLKGRVIVLDPGHGGRDNGTSGRLYPEKQLALTSALEAAKLLQEAGAKVVLTRNTDVYLTLGQRVETSKGNKADAFISFHYNAFSTTSSGIMTFYYHAEKDSSLAKMVQNELVMRTGMRDMGAKFGNYHVLRENSQPSVLLELGFLSNPNEETLVATSDYQKKAALGIYEGVYRYFLNK